MLDKMVCFIKIYGLERKYYIYKLRGDRKGAPLQKRGWEYWL
jgi:hypothetical protein